MLFSLFSKLALLLRQRLTAFGHDVQITVRCLQTLVQAIDARYSTAVLSVVIIACTVSQSVTQPINLSINHSVKKVIYKRLCNTIGSHMHSDAAIPLIVREVAVLVVYVV